MILLGAAPESLADSAGLIVTGILFVLLVLGTLAAMMTIIGKGFSSTEKRSKEKMQAAKARAATTPTASGTPAESSASAEDDADQIAAVIAAAVHAAVGGARHRVVSIRSSGGHWAAEGRRSIFASRPRR